MENKIQSLIVDDEPHASETLQWLLNEYCPYVDVIAVADSGNSGIKLIKETKPDLVFLDIEMPHVNGFDLLSQLDQVDFQLIFTTAYDQYAIQAFKVNALDYLLKPVDKDELIRAVQKVKTNIRDKTFDNKIQRLLDQLNTKKRITLPTLEGLQFVAINDIVHCDSDGSYTLIKFLNGQSLLVSKSLKSIESILPLSTFLRVHNSHIVNLDYIDKYIRGSGGYLIMNNGQHINVSRSRKDALLQAISVN